MPLMRWCVVSTSKDAYPPSSQWWSGTCTPSGVPPSVLLSVRYRFSLSHAVCISTFLPVSLYLCLSFFISVCQSLSLSVSLDLCLSVLDSVCQSLSLSVILYLCRSVFFSMSCRFHLCLRVFISFCQSLSLSVSLYLFLSVFISCLFVSICLYISVSIFYLFVPISLSPYLSPTSSLYLFRCRPLSYFCVYIECLFLVQKTIPIKLYSFLAVVCDMALPDAGGTDRVTEISLGPAVSDITR